LRNHASSEIAVARKLGFDVTNKLPGAGFKRPWPPLIKMDATVKAKSKDFSRRSSRREEAQIEKLK